LTELPTIGAAEQAPLVSGNIRPTAAKSTCLSKQFGATMTQNDFAFRIDRWTDDGKDIAEHLAGADDFQVAMATYHAARKRWPKRQ
jgi:hypothetical protein